MAIEEGTYIKTQDGVYGTVRSLSDEDATYQTASGKYYSDKISNLTQVDSTVSGFFSSESPDIIEAAENIVLFSAINKVRGSQIWDKRVMTFALESGVYEILLKDMMKKWLFSLVTETDPTANQYSEIFVTSEFYNSINKTFHITLIDTIKRLFYKEGQFTKSRMFLVLHTLASLYLSNLAHRKLFTEDVKTYKRPQ